MYIKRVQSNIKKGVDVHLSPKTLIVGPNGSGKSSIINSIEVGLTKSVSDLRGKKVVKRGKDLITLAPKDEDLICVLEMDNGRATTLTIPRTDTGGGRAKVKNAVKGALPFLDVLNVLTAKPAVLKEWVVNNVGNVISRASILEMFETDELRDRYNLLAGSSKAEEMQVIKIVAEKNKDAIKGYREELRSTEKALEKLEVSVTPSSPAKITQLEEQRTKLAQRVADLARIKTTSHNLQYELRQKEELLSRTMKVLSEHEKELDVVSVNSDLSHPISENDEFLVALRTKLINMAKVHMALGSKECMLCTKGSDIDFGSRIQSLDGMNQSLQDAIDAHNKRESVEKEVHRLRVTVSTIMNDIEALKIKLGTEYRVDDSIAQESESKLESITQQIHDLRSSAKQYQSLLDMKSSVGTFKAKIEKAKKLEDAIHRIHESLASTSTGTFITSVQAYLPSQYKFGIEIGDDVIIGFEKNGVIHEALSGAEWAMMIMAMSSACADSTIFNVLTPEERAYDPNTLYNVMCSLTDCPYQVVLTSTVLPTSVPDGWHLVELE